MPSWPAVRREGVIAMPLRAARVVPCGRSIEAIVAVDRDVSEVGGEAQSDSIVPKSSSDEGETEEKETWGRSIRVDT